MNELTVINPSQQVNQSIIDSMTLDSAKKTLEKINQFHAIVKSTLKPDIDFGVIPGTNKPTLLKPGAETILMLFGLTTTLEILSVIPPQLSKDTDFVAYTIKCRLMKNDYIVSEGLGTCNSAEKKYVSQDSLNIANTIMKMAEKRALVDAVLHVASLSAVFTQDLEDLQDYAKKEKFETMDVDVASAIKINFGKHKGKTCGEVYKTANDYVKWFNENGKDENIKRAFAVLEEAMKSHAARAAKRADEISDAILDESTPPPTPTTPPTETTEDKLPWDA
jgi:hypothetical protein